MIREARPQRRAFAKTPGLNGVKVTALPLYGSQALPKLRPGTVVDLVEGEKAADALRERRYIALGTVTGADEKGKIPDDTVLATLRGFVVRLWADNDLPGRRHMDAIARHLVAMGIAVRMVTWRDAPLKGDAADFTGTDDELRALLGKAKPWGAIAPETPASEDGSQPPLQTAKGNGHFLFLGYDDQTYSFFSKRTRQVVHLNIKLISNKDCLKQLAPLAFWESNFPSRTKSGTSWDTESASEYLISGSCGTGRIYDLGGVRGRGAWDDDGKLVLHLGNRLLVDGQQASIADYQFDEAVRRFCYEAGRSIDIQSCDPLTTEQGGQLVDLAGQFLWTNPLPHKLLLGWIVVAPLCGTLKWRPHIWLTGPAGCGKGTVLGYFVKPLMPFRFPNDFTGGTTEAGIRQSLKLDALPAIYDEAESQDDAGRARIQRLLNMLRASSSATERTVKGTTSGKALQYEMRSSFLLSSVNLLINQAADRRRIGVLELRMPEDPAQWAGLQKQLAFVTPDMGNALFARTIKLYDVLRQNIAIFGDQIGKHVGANEAGDQYGPLLAGAYLLEHDEPIDPADAYDLVAGYDWAGFGKPEPSERDERLCLDSILGTAVSLANIGGNRTQATLGELIQLMIGAVDDKSFGQVEARAVLRRHGIRIESNEIRIANRSTELDRLVRGPWAGNGWRTYLKRLPGAKTSEKAKDFAGAMSQYVALPFDLIGSAQ